MRTLVSGIDAIKVLTCLFTAIQIGIWHIFYYDFELNRINLINTKHCVYMGLITVLPRVHVNRVSLKKRV